MKYNLCRVFIFFSFCSFTACKGQATFGEKYLQVYKTIPLPGVKGRIDHMDVNLKDQVVYIAALGNNTLEAVSLADGKVLHSIAGLDEPQGVCYVPQTKEIFVANGGSGDCYFYDADNYKKMATIHLSADADDVRYDSATQKIYAGYGSGGIAIIDARSHDEVGNIKLPSHPEGFQVDKRNGLLYVNLPNTGVIGVADVGKSKLINEWNKNYHAGNFPMALDSEGNKLFIGYRHPATLVVMDTKTGKRITEEALTNDTDDLFYDAASNRVYASCGGGYINVFQWQGSDHYKQIANVPTGSGARTSLFIPVLNLFVVCEPAHSMQAALVVYRTGK
ncbi:MAG: YncE family protein [Ginsengibacter sp.]